MEEGWETSATAVATTASQCPGIKGGVWVEEEEAGSNATSILCAAVKQIHSPPTTSPILPILLVLSIIRCEARRELEDSTKWERKKGELR